MSTHWVIKHLDVIHAIEKEFGDEDADDTRADPVHLGLTTLANSIRREALLLSNRGNQNAQSIYTTLVKGISSFPEIRTNPEGELRGRLEELETKSRALSLYGLVSVAEHSELLGALDQATEQNLPLVTRSLAVQINRKLGNPFVAMSDLDDGESRTLCRTRLNEHDLRETARQLFSLRGVNYVAIDGLENIVPQQRVTGTARFDTIKAFGLPHERDDVPPHSMRQLLFGHYSLLGYWTENPQLSRRVIEVPLYPYTAAKADIVQWQRILREVSPLYPLEDGVTLSAWNDLLFDMAAGCAGILNKLLDGALTQMRLAGHERMNIDHLVAAAFPKIKMAEIRSDIENFKAFFETSIDEELVKRVKARSVGVPGNDAVPSSKRRSGRKAGPRDKVGVR
jgi:hypothetical protein